MKSLFGLKLFRSFFSIVLYSFVLSFLLSSNLHSKDDERNISVIQRDSTKNTLPFQGKYKALLIGISDYEKCPKLETPINDIRGLKRVLTSHYGFKHNNILTLEDHKATRSNIEDALFKLTKNLEEDESLLIYFAGHGQYDRAGNLSWWVPVDSDPQRPGTMISGGTVRDYIKAMKARHVLVVSDSCFSGSLFGSTRSLPPVLNDKFYTEKYALRSRWGFTSGNLSPVSDIGGNGHSIFAEQFIGFLKRNKKPYLLPSEIYAKIAPIISNNSEQLPLCKPLRYANDAGGEFLFFRLDATLPIETQVEKELTYTPSIKLKPPKNKSKRFVDNGDGTVYDSVTKLLWQKYDSVREFTYREAFKYCSKLKVGEGRSWRLPANQELTMLYQALKKERRMESIDCRIKPFQWRGSFYWSSTKGSWNNMYILSFENGENIEMGKAAKIRVRAVSKGR